MAATERLSLLIESRTTGDQEVNKLADAINRVTAASEKLNEKKVKPPDPTEFEKFAAGVKQFIQDPLGNAGEAAEMFLNKMGPMGAGVLAGSAVFGFLAKEAMGAAEVLSIYGKEIENVSLRTGLSTKEVGQFSYAAKVAGQDVTVFESAMRKLSQGLADNSEDGKKAREGLRMLGVQATDVHGNLRPMSSVFLQISEGLNSIEGTANRNAAALKIFGRAGVELLPTILGLAENLGRAKELGLGPEESDIRRWDSYHKQLVEVGVMWDRLKRQMSEPLAASASLVLHVLTDRQPTQRWRIGPNGELIPIGQNADGSPTGGTPQGNGAHVGNGGAQYGEGYHLGMIVTQRQMAAGYRAPISNSLLGYVDSLSEKAAIGKNDSAVEAALSGSSEERLSSAKKELERLRGDLKTGVLPEVNAPTLEAIAGQKQKIADLEAQIKGVKDLEQAERSLQAFEKQMSEKDLGPVSRIYAQSDDLIKKGANPERAGSAARIGATAELAKMIAEDQKRSGDVTLKAWKETEKNWDEVYKTLDKVSGKVATDFIEEAKKAQETARQIDSIQFGSYRSGIIAQSGRATRLAELNAGPGQEYNALNAGYQERLRLAQQLYDLDMDRAALERDTNKRRIDEAKAEADLVRATQDAEIEHEMKLAELQRQRVDNLRNESGQLFDALERGGAGLEQFFKNTANNWLRTMFQNAAVEAFGGSSGHLTIPGQTTNGKQNLFGKILNGTPFGTDPASKLNTAGDNLHLAAAELIGAARALAVSPSGGGGGFSSAASTFSRLYGSGSPTDAEIADAGITPDAISLLNQVPEAGPNQGSGYSVAGATASHSGTSAMYRDVGIAATAIAGAFGIYNGIQQGGARGAISATGAASGMAGGIMALAGVTGPAAPILMGLGLGLSLLPSLFGDPRQQRATDLESQRNQRLFTMPTGQDYSMDVRGQYTDYDYRGRVRPVIVNNFNNSVYAMDSVTLRDYLIANPGALAAGMASAIQGGNADDVVGALQQRT